MLNAYISGTAGRAVFVQGNEISYADAGDLATRHVASRAALRWLLADADDIIELKDTSKKAVVQRLEFEWRTDRMLRMIQIVLDNDEEEGNRREAASALNELTAHHDSRERASFHTHASPWRQPLSEVDLRNICSGYEGAMSVALDICQRQQAIATIRDAWNSVPSSTFRSQSDRASFELAAIERGVFYDFVASITGSAVTSDALLRAYSRLLTQPNSRAVINSWARDLRPERSKAELAKQAIRGELGGDTEGEHWPHEKPIHEAFTNVQRQKEGIIARLDDRDLMQARRYARQLVKMQIDAGNAEFAAKSLCSLAQEARLRGYSSIQLEWLEDAVEICPTDAWSHGQLGDAQLGFYRFDDAARNFQQAGAYGDEQFAKTGHARLLRAKGQLGEALAEFQAARDQFVNHPEAYRIWAGVGETLRDMLRLEESLSTYDQALERFPNESTIWCGRASVLKDLGRLDDALDAYDTARQKFPSEVYASSGYADVLKLMGKYDSAIEVYDRAINRFPDSLVLICGRADVLRSAHRFAEAIEAYDDARQRFSYSPVAYCGHAEALRESGSPLKALQAYEDSVRGFPLDPRSRNGLANMLRVVGRFGDALAAFDKNVRDFPYDSFALSGRASLLKLLGKYDEATQAYVEIIERLPRYEYARFGLASVHAILCKFEDALSLLPNDEPTTWESWVGRHVKGMILVRQKKYAEALELFQWCASRTPFATQKRLFEGGIALANIRLRNFEEAAAHARKADEITGKILLAHSLGALHRLEEAAGALRTINDDHPPTIVDLRDAISAKFQIRMKAKRRSDAWVADMEDVALLQAA